MDDCNKNHRLIIFLLVVFSISFVVLTGLYLFTSRFIGDGFVFERLATYIVFGRQTHIDIRGMFDAFPFAPFFIIVISRVTGLDIITTAYLPYLSIIPLIYSYFFTRFYVSKKHHALLLSLAIFSITIGKTPHFSEYYMGYFLFPVFTVIISKFYFSKFKDYRYFLLALAVLIIMKFYFPYEEIFALTFLITFLIVLYLIKKLNITLKDLNIKNVIIPLSILTILSFVMLFSYQPKFESLLMFLHSNVYKIDPFGALKNYFLGLLGKGNLVLEYGVVPRSSPILFAPNIIIILILLISIFLVFSIFILKLIKGRDFHKLKIKDLTIIFCLFAYYPLAIILLSIGQPGYLLTPLYIVGPVFIYYFAKRNCEINIKNQVITAVNQNFKLHINNFREKIPTILIFMFVVLVLSIHVISLTTGVLRPVGPDETNYALVNYLDDYTGMTIKTLTDLDTYGVLRVYFAKAEQDPTRIIHITYTDTKYSFIIGKDNETVASDIDLILVNKLTIDRPMQRGQPDWAFFRPLSEYGDDLEQNKNINLIYASSQYEVYVPNITN